MVEVVDLQARREPVLYTIDVKHNWDGTVEVEINGLADDDRSNQAAGNALSRASELAFARAKKQIESLNGTPV